MFGAKDRGSAWRSRFPDRTTCVRCLEKKDLDEMDRLLWCEACREAARERAAGWGWGVGSLAALLLALWIWFFIQPSDLVIGGWIATVVGALWVGARVAREIAYGVMRFQNRKAAEAKPPGFAPPDSGSPDPGSGSSPPGSGSSPPGSGSTPPGSGPSPPGSGEDGF